jgi:hypothetical protein
MEFPERNPESSSCYESSGRLIAIFSQNVWRLHQKGYPENQLSLIF